MVDILFTYTTPAPLSYGTAYHLAAEKLEAQGVTHAHLDLATFVSSYDFSADYLEEVVAELNPKLIISHHCSLEKSLSETTPPYLNCISVLMEEIETFFVRNYFGRIQTDSAYFAKDYIEFKEGFVRQMRNHGLPHPKSILRDEIAAEDWNYDYLRQQLAPEDGTFLIKDISLQKGRGIHCVSSSEQMLYHYNLRVAQSQIKNKSSIPCSLRINTFQDQIVGAFLMYNLTDDYRSNYHLSNMTLLNVGKYDPFKIAKIDPLLFFNGINLDLTIRKEVIKLAQKVGGIHSQSLLRGIDIIFDEESNPFLIEAQTGPGNPHQGSFARILGLRPRDFEYNLDVAAEVLSKYILQFLQQN